MHTSVFEVAEIPDKIFMGKNSVYKELGRKKPMRSSFRRKKENSVSARQT
jgi:hypothetical protein